MIAARSNSGFSLIEVMVAMVIVIILALGLASSMGAAFLADSSAKNKTAAINTAQRLIEEIEQVDYGDLLSLHEDAVINDDGMALKISVTEVMVGMVMIEVSACRPIVPRTMPELSMLTMSQFKQIASREGSQINLITYRTDR